MTVYYVNAAPVRVSCYRGAKISDSFFLQYCENEYTSHFDNLIQCHEFLDEILTHEAIIITGSFILQILPFLGMQLNKIITKAYTPRNVISLID